MNHGSLFSGIGGFDLAARWMEWNNCFHVERDDFCRDVLQHHFPESQSYEDIKQFSGYPWAGRIDVLSAGFPCQPFSVVGERKGTADDRHLWPETLRVIKEIRPTWVVAENVRGLVSWNDGLVFEEVCSSLEDEQYEVFPTLLPAAGVGAPHKRDRVWIIAYSHSNRASRASGQDVGAFPKSRLSKWHEVVFAVESSAVRGLPSNPGGLGWDRWWREGLEGRQANDGQGVQPEAEGLGGERNAPDPDSDGLQGGVSPDEHRQQPSKEELATQCLPPGLDPHIRWADFPTQPALCGRHDGFPPDLDGITFPKWRRESVKAYGNAICVPIAHNIYQAIQQYEQHI